jgi:tRNA (guanine37-N1)-methyltransferase
MRFTIVTLFPEFFESPLAVGLLGKALERELLQVECIQLRDFTTDRHRTVDDTPFGGGPGMVMLVEPLVAALESIRHAHPATRVTLLSPRGPRFSQATAAAWVEQEDVTLVCGRYEGVDERLLKGGFVDEEVSLGDFVLNGGEVAALAMVEACSRLLPGAMGNVESVPNDSFYDGLLDHPHYTRPREFRGMAVPDVLLSGNHAQIDQWRRQQALHITRSRRPDLLESVNLTPEDKRLLES